MARLIPGSIRDRGDSVLIVSCYSNKVLVGYVARSSLIELVGQPQSMHDCMIFVESRMRAIEPIMLAKSQDEETGNEAVRCIEITSADMRAAGIDPIS